MHVGACGATHNVYEEEKKKKKEDRARIVAPVLVQQIH